MSYLASYLKMSFILTMWYVNQLISFLLQVLLFRFILTMWYVNIVSLEQSCEANIVLY